MRILSCGILRNELEHLMAGQDVQRVYVEPGLHVDLQKLQSCIEESLEKDEYRSLFFGQKCHPDLAYIADKRGVSLPKAQNCIEMILGDRLADLDAEAKTFYVTAGWLENWQAIFMDGLRWDEVDARQNFGYYDRIVLLDTGVAHVDEMQVLAFYEYTQVPIEILAVDLSHLRGLIEKLLEK